MARHVRTKPNDVCLKAIYPRINHKAHQNTDATNVVVGVKLSCANAHTAEV